LRPAPAAGRASDEPVKIFPWIQALRAAAALAVAFFHVSHDAIAGGGDPRGMIAGIINFIPWEASVDVFFVISGFVIVHSSAGLFGQPAGPGIFIRRRLTRIIPLYWIMTTAFIAVLLLGRAEINGNIGGPLYLMMSYLFIPWARPDGLVQPALGLGWTLNYEMFFYILITPFLLVSRIGAVAGVVLVCCALVLAGQFAGFHNVQLAYWSSPIILDFLGGMMLAQLLAGGVRLARPAIWGLILGAAIMLHVFAHIPPGARAFAWGVPAAALVATACLGRAAPHLTRFAKLLILLGDASYAMYLVHPFIMRGFTILWHRFHVANELAGIIYILAGVTVAQSCAVVLHLHVERRLYRMLRRRTGVLKNEAV
jgi:exopolysaccharide production protein ExoZ